MKRYDEAENPIEALLAAREEFDRATILFRDRQAEVLSDPASMNQLIQANVVRIDYTQLRRRFG